MEDCGYVIEVEHLTHAYTRADQSFVAVDDVSIVVEKGEFLSGVGPSGCGKSSLLSIIAGLLLPRSGSVHVLGREVKGWTGGLA